MIVLELSEDRFNVGRSSFSVFNALFCIEPLFCCLLVLSQGMVHIDYPVVFAGMANTTHRAAQAILCLVTADQLDIARSRYSVAISDVFHLLAYRTDQIVFLLVVMQAVITEWFYPFLLFFVEGIIFDIGFDAFLLKHTIVLVRAITGIGYDSFGAGLI